MMKVENELSGPFIKKKKNCFSFYVQKKNGSFYQKQTAQNIKHLINTIECEYNSSWDMCMISSVSFMEG